MLRHGKKISKHKPGTQDLEKGIPNRGKRSKHPRDALFRRNDGSNWKVLLG